MKKNASVLLVVAIVAVIAILYIAQKPASAPTTTSTPHRYQDATYDLDGALVKLTNGMSELPIAPDAAARVVTKIFGNEVMGDFNSDGRQDIAFLLTQTGGGTGTFYYIAAALGSTNGYIGLNAVLLGDRIAPQTTEFRDGRIIVNYADRRPTQALTVRPSVGVSKYFKVENNRLVEVAVQQ